MFALKMDEEGACVCRRTNWTI